MYIVEADWGCVHTSRRIYIVCISEWSMSVKHADKEYHTKSRQAYKANLAVHHRTKDLT